MGDEAWEAQSNEARAKLLRVHIFDCWQHLRNIVLKEMSLAQSKRLKEELAKHLEKFSSWERMTTDFDQSLRAVYKEFHVGGRYYKGAGADFLSWMREHYPSVFFMHIERADGGRQDLDFDAAVPIYIDRPYLVEYLYSRVHAQHHSNILEDFLYTILRSSQYIANARANGIIDLLISRPMRWLSGKSSQNEMLGWSPVQMNGVLDLVDQVFERGKADGSIFLDRNLDIFKTVADAQPLFRDYREFTYTQDTVLSPDGKTKHLQYKLSLDELLDPSDETNQATRQKTIEYLQLQCEAGLRKMHDPKLALADKLTSQDGANAIGKMTAVIADTVHMHATNDELCESVYGAFKYCRRKFTGISVRRASGLAQAMRSGHLSHGDAVRHRTRRADPSEGGGRVTKSRRAMGMFHSLPRTEQIALVEMARAEQKAERKLDRADIAELDAFRAARRRSNSELELESLIHMFALCLSFFDRFKKRGVKSVHETVLELAKLASDQLRLDWLREQIEMRVIGLGWVEFKAKWSSGKDEGIGTVSELTGHLMEILEEEADREIPKAAVAPIFQARITRRPIYISTQFNRHMC